MNGKLSKILGYSFIIGIILLVVLNGADPSQKWVPVVRLIAMAVMILTGLFYIAVIIYCIVENKKIDNYLNNDDYDSLISYSIKKANKKSLFLEGRNNYYNYLLLLCYLAKDEHEKINEYFEKTSDRDFMYPMISYWKACYEFSNGIYDNLQICKNKFSSHKDVLKTPFKFGLLTSLLNVFVIYSQGNIKEAKEQLSKLNTSTITMPSTIRAIKIINDAEVVENEIIEIKDEKNNVE